ncbi:hypothetical protein BDY19DRAFT_994344 [Irpex rosettiformis]|uniref:Uncharacterized protein n=1 Tax=Irpex rosettiformis TaxID=378272 RepID=A0ACB8U0U6_9APHY|nr:hypothetical protein BDY19DRAFT_994344 [Irpex rosettiformis]
MHEPSTKLWLSSTEVQDVFRHVKELMKLAIVRENTYMDVDTHSKTCGSMAIKWQETIPESL